MGRAEAETIRVLRENGEAYQSDLVSTTGFSRATISTVLADLGRRKLVRISTEGRNSKITYLGSARAPGRRLVLGFTRAAEYPFLIQLRRMLREGSDVDLRFRVYENGIGVARDLASQRIDLGIAPLITVFVMHSLDAPFKIIGPAGSGGASVMKSPRSSERKGERLKAVCTRLSTMEILMRSAESRHDIPEIGRLAYADGPSQIASALMSGTADVCTIWEPYASMLEARGAKRVVRYSEMPDHLCCVAAAGTHLGERLLARLFRTYTASMTAFTRDKESSLSAYAALSGLDPATLKRSAAEYSYEAELSSEAAEGQMRAAGLVIPSPSSLKEALYRA
jgi:predicted transcriptional regulator